MRWRKALLATAACALTVLACDQLGNVCKDFFCRLRPCWDPYMVEHGLHVLEGKGGQYGFYSAHAANAVGFACCARPFLKGRRPAGVSLLALWAGLVAVSRVFVGKHFLGDVVAGAAVGAVTGCLLAGIALRIAALPAFSRK